MGNIHFAQDGGQRMDVVRWNHEQFSLAAPAGQHRHGASSASVDAAATFSIIYIPINAYVSW